MRIECDFHAANHTLCAMTKSNSYSQTNTISQINAEILMTFLPKYSISKWTRAYTRHLHFISEKPSMITWINKHLNGSGWLYGFSSMHNCKHYERRSLMSVSNKVCLIIYGACDAYIISAYHHPHFRGTKTPRLAHV